MEAEFKTSASSWKGTGIALPASMSQRLRCPTFSSCRCWRSITVAFCRRLMTTSRQRLSTMYGGVDLEVRMEDSRAGITCNPCLDTTSHSHLSDLSVTKTAPEAPTVMLTGMILMADRSCFRILRPKYFSCSDKMKLPDQCLSRKKPQFVSALPLDIPGCQPWKPQRDLGSLP